MSKKIVSKLTSKDYIFIGLMAVMSILIIISFFQMRAY